MLAHPGSFSAPVHEGGECVDLALGGRAGVVAGQGQLFADHGRAGRCASGLASQRGEGGAAVTAFCIQGARSLG